MDLTHIALNTAAASGYAYCLALFTRMHRMDARRSFQWKLQNNTLAKHMRPKPKTCLSGLWHRREPSVNSGGATLAGSCVFFLGMGEQAGMQ